MGCCARDMELDRLDVSQVDNFKIFSFVESGGGEVFGQLSDALG